MFPFLQCVILNLHLLHFPRSSVKAVWADSSTACTVHSMNVKQCRWVTNISH